MPLCQTDILCYCEGDHACVSSCLLHTLKDLSFLMKQSFLYPASVLSFQFSLLLMWMSRYSSNTSTSQDRHGCCSHSRSYDISLVFFTLRSRSFLQHYSNKTIHSCSPTRHQCIQTFWVFLQVAWLGVGLKVSGVHGKWTGDSTVSCGAPLMHMSKSDRAQCHVLRPVCQAVADPWDGGNVCWHFLQLLSQCYWLSKNPKLHRHHISRSSPNIGHHIITTSVRELSSAETLNIPLTGITLTMNVESFCNWGKF